jgi:hypothetical protein
MDPNNHLIEIIGHSVGYEGISKVLEGIAVHYFGDLDNLISFPGVKLPGVGRIDYVLARHKLMKAEIDDLIMIELYAKLSHEIEQTILDKSIIYKAWNIKSYWVIPKYILDNLIKRYSFVESDSNPKHTFRFVLQNDLITQDDSLTCTLSRYISADIDESYHLHSISDLPKKDEFVQNLSTRLQAELLKDLAKRTRRLNDH